MVHVQVITPQDLNSFAGTRDGQETLPELIALLIRGSVSQLSECRIPYGDSVGQTGLDGLVSTVDGFGEFVPDGDSYWECGTGQDPQSKATGDLGKRTKQVSDATVRANTTFVVATLRNTWDEARQRSWKKRHEAKGWKSLKVVDGIVLSDWLREFPSVARWLMRKIDPARASSSWRTTAEHWENLLQLSQADDPPLPPGVFLVGRNQAIEEVKRVFEGRTEQLCLGVENSLDAEDFVAALVESQDADTRVRWAGNCVFVQGADEWASMLQLRARHVLVASGSLDLEDSGQQLRLAAKKARHAVIFPAGLAPTDAVGVNKLPSPSTAQIEEVLLNAGYSPARVKVLAQPSSSLLTSLKRRLENLPDLPSYASGPAARAFAQIGLLGRLHGGNPKDIEAFERVLGKSHGEWLEMVRPEVVKPGTPLSLQGQNWKVVARGEAWGALGAWIDDDDLNRFQDAATLVLGELDPAIDVSKEQRWTALMLGKQRQYSDSIRMGIAETIALLGCRPGPLSQCSTGHAERVAGTVVRGLLREAEWEVWMSLHDLLPMLAEAAPRQFIEAVECALADPASSPFPALFAQEGDGIAGWNYLSGLLWSLETLAWHPDYLGRALQALAGLAAMDPGGSWANRPSNSMSTILLPWHPQTTASIQSRIAAVRAVNRDHPDVAWALVISLLPKWRGFSSGSRRPVWRTDLMAGWGETVQREDYFEEVEIYAGLAVDLAGDDTRRLSEIAEKLPELPASARGALLQRLGSAEFAGLEERVRQPIWEALVDLAARHRAFPGAKWAMSSDEISQIEKAAESVAPTSPAIRHRRLFSDRDFDLFESHESHQEQERRLASRRQGAILDVLGEVNVEGVVEFAAEVAAPAKVGEALGAVDRPSDDSILLPALLSRGEPHVRAFVAGFIHGRWQEREWRWVDGLPLASWSPEDQAALLSLLRFSPEVWRRAEEVLGERADLYWQKINPWPWGLSEGLAEAVERLLQHGRPRVALAFCGAAVRSKQDLPPDLAVRALQQSRRSDGEVDHFDPQAAVSTIQWLQQVGEVDEEEMGLIEWSYLPLLEDRHGAAPRVLEAQLARDPARFCEMIRRAYRSEQAGEDPAVPSEEEKLWARAAYRLLQNMRAVPGRRGDGVVDATALREWLNEVKRLASASGHLRSALQEVGRLFGRAVQCVNDWHDSMAPVADALDASDAEPMRREFASQLYNNRGVFSPSGGREEREIAEGLRTQAVAVEARSLIRLAGALRDLAEGYMREAEQEEREIR